MDFLRNSAAVARDIAVGHEVFATLAIGRDTLLDRDELLGFLNEITLSDNPPDGFYVLIATNSSEARTEMFHADVIAGWMLINYTLAVNGYPGDQRIFRRTHAAARRSQRCCWCDGLVV